MFRQVRNQILRKQSNLIHSARKMAKLPAKRTGFSIEMMLKKIAVKRSEGKFNKEQIKLWYKVSSSSLSQRETPVMNLFC